jgi:Mce-associated membrane protein
MAGASARPAQLTIAVLALLAVLLGGAAWWVGGQLGEEQARDDDRAGALAAAGTHAVNLLSLNHKSVESDLARILATSTGQARAEYTANAGRLKETTLANKVVQHGVLRAAGLESLSGGTAKVLVVADVEIRWEGSKNAPQERFYRWSMEVTKVSGVWLVSKAVQVL